jgi:hypothetical protein
MRHVDGLYTQRFNRAHGRDGPLFRGRYQAILVEADVYLSAVVRYIHWNPVAAGLVATPDAYPWSSHRYYLSPRRAPPWLTVGELLATLGGPRAFRRFVLAGNAPSLEQFYARGRQQPVLGGEDFRARLPRRAKALAREHPRQQRRLLQPTATAVVTRVAAEYGVPPRVLQQGRRGSVNEARKVAIYLVHRLCDMTLKEIAPWFGLTSYGAVGWACSQVRQRVASDTKLRRQLERLEGSIIQQKT